MYRETTFAHIMIEYILCNQSKPMYTKTYAFLLGWCCN